MTTGRRTPVVLSNFHTFHFSTHHVFSYTFIHRLVILFAFETEDGRGSSETCISNLKQLVFLFEDYLLLAVHIIP